MTRLFLIFAGFFALAAGAAWLADHPGTATLTFAGFTLYTSFAAIAVAAVLLAATVGGLVWLIGYMRRELPVVGKNSAIKHQRQGLEALNKALVALSAGDHQMAGRLAGRAELLLPPQPMVDLVAAEAALRGGDHKGARERFKRLEQSDSGALIGLRGLAGEARRAGRFDEALHLVRKAFDVNPSAPWVLKTLFSLEVEAGHWGAAQDILKRVARDKLLSPDQIARHKGALAYAQGTALALAGKLQEARKAFQEAVKLRGPFAPATAALARLDKDQGQKAKASKALIKAWGAAPHPLLAKVYKELDPAESGADWLARVRPFVVSQEGHIESDVLLADAHLDARDGAGAAPVVDRLMRAHPDRRAWTLKLRLLTLEGASTDNAEQALEAARAPAGWVCEDCHARPTSWTPICASCGAFDRISWGGAPATTRPVATLADTPVLLSDTDLAPPVVD